MSMDTVTVREIKAASARLAEIIALHAAVEVGPFSICGKCRDTSYPCATVKLTRRALRSLTGATP